MSDAPLTAEEIAQAVREETLSFEDGLIYHLLFNCHQPIEDVALFVAITLAIGWANLGQMNKVVDLPDGPTTVGEIIERFNLRPFVDEP